MEVAIPEQSCYYSNFLWNEALAWFQTEATALKGYRGEGGRASSHASSKACCKKKKTDIKSDPLCQHKLKTIIIPSMNIIITLLKTK